MGEGAAAPGSESVGGEAPTPRRRLPRTLALLALLLAAAAAWVGVRSWIEHRERVRLREVMRGEIAAREAAIPRPAPIDAGDDAASTYAAAFGAVNRPAMNRLARGLLIGTRVRAGVVWNTARVLAGPGTGTRPGPTAEADLATSAKALELFEKALAFPANSTRDFRRMRWGEMASLFAARASKRAGDGDLDGALRDLVAVHRAVRQWRAPWPFVLPPDAWNSRVVDLLAVVATDRRLGAAAAREGLAALLTAEECRRIQRERYALFRVDRDRSLLELLGSDAQGAMLRRGMWAPSAVDRLLWRFRGGGRDHLARLPTTRDVERARDAANRFEAILRGDPAAAPAAVAAFRAELLPLPLLDLAKDAGLSDANHFANALEFETVVGLVRTALAIRVHEVERGAPPASLEEIAPGILDALPVDPYTGKPFRFTLTPEGWDLSGEGPPADGATLHYPRILKCPPGEAPAEGR